MQRGDFSEIRPVKLMGFRSDCDESIGRDFKFAFIFLEISWFSASQNNLVQPRKGQDGWFSAHHMCRFSGGKFASLYQLGEKLCNVLINLQKSSPPFTLKASPEKYKLNSSINIR